MPTSSEHSPDRPIPQTQSDNVKLMPLGSSFQDLFAGGKPVWLKIIGAAVATPVIVVVMGLRVQRKGGGNFPTDPLVLVTLAVCSAVVGALVGMALSLKDIVHARRAAGLPVSLPLRAMYCGGILSAIFIWGPIAVVLLIIGLSIAA